MFNIKYEFRFHKGNPTTEKWFEVIFWEYDGTCKSMYAFYRSTFISSSNEDIAKTVSRKLMKNFNCENALFDTDLKVNYGRAKNKKA